MKIKFQLTEPEGVCVGDTSTPHGNHCKYPSCQAVSLSPHREGIWYLVPLVPRGSGLKEQKLTANTHQGVISQHLPSQTAGHKLPGFLTCQCLLRLLLLPYKAGDCLHHPALKPRASLWSLSALRKHFSSILGLIFKPALAFA